jgi:hypothetical protein
MIYNSIPNNVIIELLYNHLSLEAEFHLINLHNYIKGFPLIKELNQLIRFKTYISLFERMENIPEKYPKPDYDIKEVKDVIKAHFNMYEVRKNDRIIAIRINKNLINVS